MIFHFWYPSMFIPGSTFIREMRVVCLLAGVQKISYEDWYTLKKFRLFLCDNVKMIYFSFGKKFFLPVLFFSLDRPVTEYQEKFFVVVSN